MKIRDGFSGKWLILLLIIGMIFSFSLSYAQDEFDELEEEGVEEVKCFPENLTTVYDSLVSDELGAQQLGIWYSLAREEFKYKNYVRAIPYYWKVLVNDKTGKFKVCYSKLAQCYYSLEKPQPDSVLLIVARGLEKYPNTTLLHYYASLVHDRLGHTKCAIPHYEALTKADPARKNYWVKLAQLYFQLEDEKCIETQQKVIDLDAADIEAQQRLVQMVKHFGGDVLDPMRLAYKKDPENVKAALAYGREAFNQGLYEEALVPLQKVISIDAKNVNAYELLGRSYEGMEKLRSALKQYREILSIEPKNLNVLCLAASVYSRLADFTTARSYVYKAARIEPGNGLPYMVLAEVYQNAVDYCSNKRGDNKLTYEDKLLYKRAQDALVKARKDPNHSNEAKRQIAALATLVPTKSDLFMQKNRMDPKGACYSWVSK